MQAWQPCAHLAAPGHAFGPSRAALQPTRRGAALAATAGEAGENEAERHGSFFNRKAELQSLAAGLASAPKSVLVMMGPPSCGKSGARLLRWCFLCLCCDDSPVRTSALLKQLVAGVKQSPRPTIIDCRAGGTFCVHGPLGYGVLMLASSAVAQTT